MIKKLTALVTLLFVFVLPASAIVIDGSIYTAGVSKYLWRGGLLNDGPAIQSGVSFGAEGITLQLWTSAHQEVSPDLFDEVDLYANYEHTIPYLDVVSLGIGYASYFAAPYNYPNLTPSQEINITIKSDILTTPYITYYHSLDASTSYNYFEAGMSYEHETGEILGGKTLVGAAATLGLNLNQITIDTTTLEASESARFTVAGMSVYFNYEIAGFTITPLLFFQLALNDTNDWEAANLYGNNMAISLTVNYDFSMGEEEKTEEKAAE